MDYGTKCHGWWRDTGKYARPESASCRQRAAIDRRSRQPEGDMRRSRASIFASVPPPAMAFCPKKGCPRLRDSACWRSGEITQPRTNFLANSVQWCSISVVTWLKGRACMQCDGEKVNTPLFVPTCSNGNANDYREQSVLHMSFVDLGL